MEHLEEFLKLLPKQAMSERSWREPIENIKAKNFDLKALNPNRKEKEDKRTPQELLELIEAQKREIDNALIALQNKMK